MTLGLRRSTLLVVHLQSGKHENLYRSTCLCLTLYRNAHIYGIDLADTKELVAYGRSEDDVATEIGADRVIYQTLDDLVKSCATLNPNIQNFEVGVFNGEYVTGVDPAYFKHLEGLRGENAKAKRKEAALQAVTNGTATQDEVGLVMSNGTESETNGTAQTSYNDVSLHNIYEGRTQ